jgi:hypothetical protein
MTPSIATPAIGEVIQSGLPERGAVLATVKMRPGNGGASLTRCVPADPDGVCARRQRAAMPERLNVRCKCSALLTGRKPSNLPLPHKSGLGNIPR